jgi:predicted esterase
VSFRAILLLALLAGLPCACGVPSAPSDRGSARLEVVVTPPTQTIAPGIIDVPGAGSERAGILYVPTGYDGSHPVPLVLAFHGAGIAALGPINLLSPYAEERGVLLLSVESRAATWDAIYGPYGTDLATIERALRFAFDHCAVDPARLAIEGFSDGASYALGVGLANGDLFSHIIAFSPGFIPPTSSPDAGKPPVFLSHGRQDPVLPIDGASRFIASLLGNAGYDVTFLEFDGGHTVPATIAAQAMQWLTQ